MLSTTGKASASSGSASTGLGLSLALAVGVATGVGVSAVTGAGLGSNNDRVLATEVAIHSARSKDDFGADFLHGSLMKARLAETLCCRFQDVDQLLVGSLGR